MILSALEGHGVPGGFVVGLGVDREEAWLVYDVDDEGFLAEGLGRDRLAALGWRRGQAVVVVARRREGDGLGALVEALGEEVGADVWYPAAGAGLRVTGDGWLQAVGSGGGEPTGLWLMYESRSLRSSGIEVPAWLGVSDEGVLVPAVPPGGFFLFSFPGGMASAGPDGFPGILPLLERAPCQGYSTCYWRITRGASLASLILRAGSSRCPGTTCRRCRMGCARSG